MHTTPNRKGSVSHSAFLEPFFFETPRVRRFYEKNIELSDEKPHFDCHKIFTLMESPADAHSLAKRNLIMLKNMDIFSESFEMPRTSEKKREDVLEFIPQPVQQVKYMSAIKPVEVKETEAEHDKSTTVCSRIMSDFKIPEVTEQNFEELEEHEKIPDQMFKFSFDGKENEIRKRKRKTSHQLKILQAEFDKDDNWDKDKITHVSKVTGLSESQVYKWCWDQKKKVDGIVKEKPKFDPYEDKENIYPKGESCLLPQSKCIQKMKKKTKPFNPVSITRQFTMSPEFYGNFDDNFISFEGGFNL